MRTELIAKLSENRELVISKYNNIIKFDGQNISLKEFMNIVIWWFENHTGSCRKFIKGDMSYLFKAIEIAEAKNFEKSKIYREARAEHIAQMHCSGWIAKRNW